MTDERERARPRRQVRQSGPKKDDPVPAPQPPVTEDDVRRGEELVEKYGLQHLRKKP